MSFPGVRSHEGARDHKVFRVRADRPEKTYPRASLTLEAAMVLPLFLMAVLVLISYMDAVAGMVKKDLELSNRARALAAYGYLYNMASDEDAGEGIWIDFMDRYVYEPPFTAFGIGRKTLPVRARVYPFIGYKPGSDDASETPSAERVYVTENESVIHTHADCTHLDLAIYRTTYDNIGSLRNAYGRKYKPCKGFPADYEGTVYATEKGEYYYPSTMYGSLTRRVRCVDKSEYDTLPVCSRCAARDHDAAMHEDLGEVVGETAGEAAGHLVGGRNVAGKAVGHLVGGWNAAGEIAGCLSGGRDAA